MNTAELKKLAEASTKDEWFAGTSPLQIESNSGIIVCNVTGSASNESSVADAAYIAAANPSTILKLLQINAELVEALKHGCPPDCKDGMTDSGGAYPWGEPALVPCPTCTALAKAEGGEL